MKKLNGYECEEKAAIYDKTVVPTMLRIAVPSTLQQSIVHIGILLVQSCVNSFGSAALAGYAAGTRIESLSIVPMLAMGNAMSTFTAQNIGAGKLDRVKEGYKMYVIPDNVGGRYSVLTPVGLLPIAVAGYDIEKLVKGACEMKAICTQHSSVVDNPALLYAAVRNILYRKGKKVEMMVTYEPSLKYIAEWWKQLYGESEGKDGKGILPHSVTFTTDLHSMGQYIQDGERIMFETVLNVEHSNTNVNIPYDDEDADGLNYLQQRTITEINHAAVEGTTLAHVSGGVPVMKIEMPKIDETILGELIYMMEYACGVSGYMLDVNPFDQPGVEAYKRNMFHILGKKGY
jgi:glucose-6-phosphate isomerase